jgi:hypothetical protein
LGRPEDKVGMAQGEQFDIIIKSSLSLIDFGDSENHVTLLVYTHRRNVNCATLLVYVRRIKGFIKIPIKLKKLKYEGQGKTP